MINFGGVSLTGENYIDFNDEEVCSVFWEENGRCSQVWPDRNYWLMEETSTVYDRPLYSCYCLQGDELIEKNIDLREGTICLLKNTSGPLGASFRPNGTFKKTAHYHLQNTSNTTITYKIKYKDGGILKFSSRNNFSIGGSNGDIYYFTDPEHFRVNLSANTNCFTLSPFSETYEAITLLDYTVSTYNGWMATICKYGSLVIECVPPYIDIEITDENNNVLFCCDCAQANGILSGELPRVFY